MTRKEIEALAREISASEGLSWAEALEIAAAEVRSLVRYAEEWDTWVAAWHDVRPAVVSAA